MLDNISINTVKKASICNINALLLILFIDYLKKETRLNFIENFV